MGGWMRRSRVIFDEFAEFPIGQSFMLTTMNRSFFDFDIVVMNVVNDISFLDGDYFDRMRFQE